MANRINRKIWNKTQMTTREEISSLLIDDNNDMRDYLADLLIELDIPNQISLGITDANVSEEKAANEIKRKTAEAAKRYCLPTSASKLKRLITRNYTLAWFYDKSESNRCRSPFIECTKWKEDGQVGIKAFAKEPAAHAVVKGTAREVLKRHTDWCKRPASISLRHCEYPGYIQGERERNDDYIK
ncbi:hypothetical protein C2G38_2193098 [Gigaspora rosea]|uniref:Uncharacterized protein n=1 Tax=Gigaspora rosea TaxID=44941 RepID=A0A397UZZ2_9GLOM|nr:hypothetical protein C2G38_2193098 [Gigaspora rosea]